MRNDYHDPRWIRLLLIVLVLVLAGCSSNIYLPVNKAGRVTQIALNNFTPTDGLMGTETPELTSTKTLSPTPTQLKTAAQTSSPTLSIEKAEARVYELLKNNAGCFLPCWWGIIPGLSSTEEALSILEPFIGIGVNDPTYKFTVNDGYFSMKPLSSGIDVGFQYFAEDGIISIIYISTAMIKDVYTAIFDDPFYQEIMSAYTLKAILTKYGKPNQVLIRSFSELARENYPSQVLLYYPGQGIVVQYFSQNGLFKENNAYVLPTCPPRSYISLRLFNPESGLSLNEILRLNDSFRQYKDISVATNMDLDTFYETYREYDEKILQFNCPTLITPEDIWPSEYHNP